MVVARGWRDGEMQGDLGQRIQNFVGLRYKKKLSEEYVLRSNL